MTTSAIQHVFVIAMENHDSTQIYGNTTDANRIIELVWASVTEELLGVRSRLERWPTRPTAVEPA